MVSGPAATLYYSSLSHCWRFLSLRDCFADA